MNEPKFTGVWIPAAIFQTTTISITAKVVYGVLESLDNEGGCFASNAYLSKHLGLEERQVRNLLADLEAAGLITRIEETGRRIIRTIERVAIANALTTGEMTVSEGGNKLPRGRQEIATGGGNKLPTYNKVDNKGDKIQGTEAMWIVRLPFGSEAFVNAWKGWVAYHKERKKPLKDATVQAQCNQFKDWGEDKSIYAIQQSIMQGWAGIFEPKKNIGVYKAKPLTAEDHNQF